MDSAMVSIRVDPRDPLIKKIGTRQRQRTHLPCSIAAGRP
jgi:hypothetical protein